MSTAKRKLAAIVFADIAGFTDKASQDESAALSARDRVERLIKASTLSHNGRIVKTMGDGSMMEFASAVEAVSCALDIQDQMEHLNAELGLSDPIAVRVGVHVGDVVEEDSDLYGNAVNIASRVHAMAKPGGICITREVYVQIRPILKLQCMPVAGTASDRMPEKVEVFAVLGGEIEGAVSNAPKRRFGLLAGVGIAAILVAVLFAANAFFASRSNSAQQAGALEAHRILLPDWVTPGEWFALDAGARSEDLAVYFGNRKADSRVENGRLLVRTPADLPTEQTTIAVFEGGSGDALMRQQTQVIRYGALAMNTWDKPADPLGDEGPTIEISSPVPVPSKTDPTNQRPQPSGTRPSSIAPRPGAQSAGQAQPPSVPAPDGSHPIGTPAPPNLPKIVHVSPLGSNPDYNTLVSSIGSDDDVPMRFEFKALEKLPEEIGKAMKAMNIAQHGDREKALQQIREVRLELKNADPNVAVETESLLKTAEAFLEAPGKPGTRVSPHPKFAEAFAYSVNRGTRNLPGLVFVERQIVEKRFEEAKRALDVLKKRPDLTEGEKKAITRLEKRIGSGESEKAPSN